MQQNMHDLAVFLFFLDNLRSCRRGKVGAFEASPSSTRLLVCTGSCYASIKCVDEPYKSGMDNHVLK